MYFLKKALVNLPVYYAASVGRFLLLISLLLAAAAARGASTNYYSSAAPTVATQPTGLGCTLATCGGVQVGTAAQLANMSFAANVYASNSGPVALRLPLTGVAPAGYRAGMLVSSLGNFASLSVLPTVTLRTYLGNVLQESKVVDVTALQASLVAGKGSPEQLEFTSTMPFDQVELGLSNIANVGPGLQVQYAYGVQPNAARQVVGYVSRFSSPAGKYDTGGCTSCIGNPDRAVDTDLTNFATFASLATVNYPEQLRVSLEGNAPAGYRAGFVVGGGDNLLNAGILSGVGLRTYLNGVPQEYATGTSLLELGVLSSGQGVVSFPTSQPFNAVAIERVGDVTTLDNMQLYYGVGTSAAPAVQKRSDWADPTGHYQTAVNSLVCVDCGITAPQNAASGNLDKAARIQVGLGIASNARLALDLNGAGVAGNRAGMVVGRPNKDLLDATALSRVTLTTYDAANNVLETHTGSSLLTLATLPDGRQSITFNSTRDFAKVGITIGGVAGLVDTTDVYYAFADDSNGNIVINPPASPLPVQLVSLAVRRLGVASGAEITWATASELNSASFVVERSANPASGFIAVGQVEAAGNSATTRQYSLRDPEAASLAGTLYYRLRQLDRDGTATLSKAVALAGSAALASYSLYPNPATAATVTLSAGGSSLPAGATAHLYSGLGQALGRSVAVAEGQATVALPTTGLQPGLYYVVLRDAVGQVLTTQRLQVAGE